MLVAWVMEGYIGKGQLGVRDSPSSLGLIQGLHFIFKGIISYGVRVLFFCIRFMGLWSLSGVGSGVGSVSWSAFF